MGHRMRAGAATAGSGSRFALPVAAHNAVSLCSCGLSETRVTNNFDALPSSVLCQKMMDNDGLGFQLRIAGEIVSKRGEIPPFSRRSRNGGNSHYFFPPFWWNFHQFCGNPKKYDSTNESAPFPKPTFEIQGKLLAVWRKI